MKRIVNSGEMKSLDQNTIENHGIPSLVLMERAALAVCKNLKEFDLKKVLAVCGTGNNGGDGIAVARMLHLSGIDVTICLIGNEEHLSKECRIQKEIAQSYHVPFVNKPDCSEYTTIIDGIFGVGLTRPVQGRYREIIEEINESEAKVMAVDIPSGIHADHGQIMGCAVKADVTVTFAFGKIGQNLYPGIQYCGECRICDIGIYEYRTDTAAYQANRFQLEMSDLRMIPSRKADGNKGTFGKVLVVAGSKGMAGAAVLCARAVLRCGAGMVKVVTHESNRVILQQCIPEAMTSSYESEAEAYECLDAGISWADAAVFGCGLGISSCSEGILSYMINNFKKPMVIDADGLNLLSKNRDRLHDGTDGNWIVTPHIGEMARLTGKPLDEIKAYPLQTAQEFAEKYGIQCVLKDAVTCIAVPKKNHDLVGTVYLNTNGNNGMATAGSGDVLAGIIAGLLAVGTPLPYAGALGAFVHGCAGTLAKEKAGASYMNAGDLIHELQYLRLAE